MTDLNPDSHSFYSQRFKLMSKTIESVLSGFVSDWVAGPCPDSCKESFKPIQKIAEKNAYRIANGSVEGYSQKPLKILLAEPAEDYDKNIAGFLKVLVNENILTNNGVILSDGVPDTDFSKYLDAILGKKNILVHYNDNLARFRNVAESRGQGYTELMRTLEERNYQTFAPTILAHKNKTAVQKIGLLEALEGSIQQCLLAEGIPYLVLLPTGIKQDHSDVLAVDTYVKRCIAKTAERMRI
jgi:hypothetical protein